MSSTTLVSRLSLLCLLFLSTESFSPKPHSPQLFTVSVAPLSQRHATSNTNEEEEEEEGRYQDWRRKQEEIEKKVRLQIKVDEEKELEKNAMGYFDLSEEMLCVESIAPGLPLDSPERLVDDAVSQLEGELYAAVDHFQFPLAQQKSEEISQLHIDDCGAVLQVNSAYYRAFSEKNYTRMEQIWLHDASALCIHPSHKPLVGAPAVLEMWRTMFESAAGDFQRNWMEPVHMKLVVKGTTAIITCDEHVYARRFVRGQRRETELMNRLTATNIFRKVAGKWYMVHHHASWHANSEASRMAMTVSGSGSGKDRGSIKGNNNGVVDGIMGTKDFGPYLGNMDKPQGPVKKIIMGGSLSDLLSGNIDDILSGGKSGGDDASGAIIKITGNLGDLDDDDDDEDDDDLDDDVEDVDEEVSSFVKELHMLREQNSKSSKSKKSSASDPSSGTDGGSKDNIRQSCITALRKLSNQGSISQKQKRVLLTDIISCSARGEYSMVEVAYELLCGEGDDKDVAEEEFADQCRVFFESLS